MSLTEGSTVLIVQDTNSLNTIKRQSRNVRNSQTSNNTESNRPDAAEEQHETQLENAYQQQIEGNWKQFSGRVREAWGVLTDDDVDRAEGRVDQLVGTIEEKTGEARAAIARKLNELASSIQG
ncbi:MAG: CsbD family protein [Rhodothermia bacterium]|nr:CsbD family protein [Rhodothermia bacterium]